MEMKGGLRRGPMHGIPVALKDIYETAGMHDDRPFASQEGLCAGDRRRDGAAPERWRRRHPGQARHARVRQRRDDAGPAVPGRAQSLEHRVPARRLVERLGRGGRGPALHGCDGLRHRRLDPQPGRLLRHRRHQADLRAGQPLRHLPAQLQLRHGGPARLDDRRLRADARRAGGLRPQRPGLGQDSESRLRRVGPSADQGHAHRAGAELVRGQGRRHARDEGGHRRGGARAEGSRRHGRGRRLPRHPGLSHLRPGRDHGRGARHPSARGDRDSGECSATRHAGASSSARSSPPSSISLRSASGASCSRTRARRCAATIW